MMSTKSNLEETKKYYTEFEHYGVTILRQTTENSFEDTLKQKGIDYVALPFVDDIVYRYIYDGKRKYAYITYGNLPDEYTEHVYITSEIPEDMNWKNIELDYLGQTTGEEPMIMQTRAKVLYDAAKDIVRKNGVKNDENILLHPFYKIDEKELNYALISLGSNLEELRAMEHYDVDDID